MQVSEITALFNTIDRNGDGQITTKEMKKSLGSLSAEEKNSLSFLIGKDGKVNKSAFKMLANGDKKVSQNDLLSYLTTTDDEDNTVELTEEQEESRDNTLSILSNIDKKKDGKITRKEMQKAYKKATKNGDQETIDYLENFMTTNSKGKKVVDKTTFKYISTSGIVKHKKSNSKVFQKRAFSIYGYDPYGISVSSKHTTKAATLNDFIKFDDDGDYDLSETEVSKLNEYKDYFYTLDSKQDGRISKKDIIKAYKNAEEGSDEKEMLSSLVTVTSKNKVKINKENFRTLAQGKKYLNSTDILYLKTNDSTAELTSSEVNAYLDDLDEFMALDTNNNGQLSFKEIKKAAKNGSNSDLVNYITSADGSKKKLFKIVSNGKKYITAEDFRAYYKNTQNNNSSCESTTTDCDLEQDDDLNEDDD